MLKRIEERYKNQGYENPWGEDWTAMRNSAFMCAYPLIKEACPDVSSPCSPVGVVEYWKDSVNNGIWSSDFELKGPVQENLDKDWVRVTTKMCRISISCDGISVKLLPDRVYESFIGEIGEISDFRDSFGSIGL